MPDQTTKKPTVVVTTAGSAPTPGTILHLRARGFRVVATDIDPAAPGLYLADRGCLVPPGDSEAFLPRMRQLCAEEGAVAIVPLVDEELLAVGTLDGPATTVLLPRPEFVRTCLDKYVLMRELEAAGIGVPRTWSAAEWSARTAGAVPQGLVVKPRSGRGSRGVSFVDSARDVARVVAEGGYGADELVVQERVHGPEYTVSVVTWRDGKVQAVVPKEVVLKQGVTKYAVTRRNEAVIETCRAVQEVMRADGPFNVQLCLDGQGVPRVFEINPRFSSTAALTVASGVDEVAGLLRQAVLDGPPLSDEWHEGVAMVRRWTDEFLSEAQFASHGISPAPPPTAPPAGDQAPGGVPFSGDALPSEHGALPSEDRAPVRAR